MTSSAHPRCAHSGEANQVLNHSHGRLPATLKKIAKSTIHTTRKATAVPTAHRGSRKCAPTPTCTNPQPAAAVHIAIRSTAFNVVMSPYLLCASRVAVYGRYRLVPYFRPPGMLLASRNLSKKIASFLTPFPFNTSTAASIIPGGPHRYAWVSAKSIG